MVRIWRMAIRMLTSGSNETTTDITLVLETLVVLGAIMMGNAVQRQCHRVVVGVASGLGVLFGEAPG